MTRRALTSRRDCQKTTLTRTSNFLAPGLAQLVLDLADLFTGFSVPCTVIQLLVAYGKTIETND